MRIGSYEVEDKLAEGGMAEVLLARSRGGRQVVLKRALRPTDAMAQRRLRDEGKLGRRLNGTGFVETVDVLDDGGSTVLALEWIDGVPLEALWKVARLTPWMVAKLGSEVAAAIAVLHDVAGDDGRALGAVHRDLSSRNVLVEAGGRARVIDLGCALFDDAERSARTEAGNVLGTLRYLAPEVFETAKACQASDVWSIGVLLLEAALGRAVFKGNPRDVAAAVFFRDPFGDVDVQALDSRMLGVLKRLLRRDPSARPSAGRVAEDLALLADELANEARDLCALIDRARSAMAAGLIQVGTTQPSPPPDDAATAAAEATTRDARIGPATVAEGTTEPDGHRGADDDDDDRPTVVDASRDPAKPSEDSDTARFRRAAPPLSLEVDTPVRPMFRGGALDAPPSLPSEASVAGVFAVAEEVPIRLRSAAGLVPVHTIRLAEDDIDEVEDRSAAQAWPQAPAGSAVAPPLPIDPQRSEPTMVVARVREALVKPHRLQSAFLVASVVLIMLAWLAARSG